MVIGGTALTTYSSDYMVTDFVFELTVVSNPCTVTMARATVSVTTITSLFNVVNNCCYNILAPTVAYQEYYVNNVVNAFSITKFTTSEKCSDGNLAFTYTALTTYS